MSLYNVLSYIQAGALPRDNTYRFAVGSVFLIFFCSLHDILAGVWIRESVSRMFNSVRIPQHDCDTLSPISPPSDPLSHNVIVVANNWFYTLQAYDPSLEKSNSRILINPQTFRSRLNSIVRDATTRCGAAPEIGVLSADDRDAWASVRLLEAPSSSFRV